MPGRLFNNNAIYMLQARRAQGAEDLVLRILNCHAWRRGRNGTSEVGVLKPLGLRTASRRSQCAIAFTIYHHRGYDQFYRARLLLCGTTSNVG